MAVIVIDWYTHKVSQWVLINDLHLSHARPCKWATGLVAEGKIQNVTVDRKVIPEQPCPGDSTQGHDSKTLISPPIVHHLGPTFESKKWCVWCLTLAKPNWPCPTSISFKAFFYIAAGISGRANYSICLQAHCTFNRF